MLEFRCRVASGRGLAARLRTEDIKDIENSLGIPLIGGSLNLVSRKPVWLDSGKAVHSNLGGHFYWRASLNGEPILISRWSGSCPVHIYEAFSDKHLRSHFGLNDGDIVTLQIDTDIVNTASGSHFNKLTWYAVWYGREKLAYRDGIYSSLIGHWRLRNIVKRITHNADRQVFSTSVRRRGD